MRKIWAGTALVLAMCAGSCGKSESEVRDDMREFFSDPQNVARVEAFVLANARFTMLHELGHFLVDQYGLTTYGADEIASDRLAILGMLPKPRPAGSPQELWDAALNPDSPQLLWVLQFWEYVAEKEPHFAYLDKHPPGDRRAGQIACLLYGSDPDRFSTLIDRYQGEDNDKAECIQDAARNSRDWGNVVLPNLENLDQVELKRRLNMAFEYYADEPFALEAQISFADRIAPAFLAGDFLKEHMVLEEIADIIRRLKPPPERALPPAKPGETETQRIVRWEEEQQVKVFSVNGEANAWWDSTKREIAIGYPPGLRLRNGGPEYAAESTGGVREVEPA